MLSLEKHIYVCVFVLRCGNSEWIKLAGLESAKHLAGVPDGRQATGASVHPDHFRAAFGRTERSYSKAWGNQGADYQIRSPGTPPSVLLKLGSSQSVCNMTYACALLLCSLFWLQNSAKVPQAVSDVIMK